MGLRFTSGARVAGCCPEIGLAITAALGVYDRHGKDCWVTSLTEGKHRRGSLHYVGAAVDLRTKHLPGGSQGPSARAVADQLRDALGPEYDVVLEKDHVHVEFQPKAGLNLPG